MRSKLLDSTAAADLSFVRKLDRLRYEEMKALVLVYVDGIPERLAKVEGAKTLTDIQRVFIELVDEAACRFVDGTSVGSEEHWWFPRQSARERGNTPCVG